MRYVATVLLVLLLASCSSPAQLTDTPGAPASEVTPTLSARQATLIASEPSMVITFDGEECTVEGPDEIPPGEHVFLFRNRSDINPYLAPIRHYPGYSWQDALTWVEENCGPPGTYCDILAPWMAGLGPEGVAYDGSNNQYKRYVLTIEADYSHWTETAGSLLWPCGPFSVVAGD